ncbi:hypothetical protein ACH5RR_004856 [Cinchona calisaya]|uniref:Uncharacterized protein n=1 Tax=Cinchona calisaya TaxID=153742 RepID=A0ABD3AYQ7_9GENT
MSKENRDRLEETTIENISIQEDQLEQKEDCKADDREHKGGETSVSSMELEKPCILVGTSQPATEVADDDDGFKTPTSAEHNPSDYRMPTGSPYNVVE